MKLLLNDKEIAHFLLSKVNYKKIITERGLDIHFYYTNKFLSSLNPKMLEAKNKERLHAKITKNVKQDAENYLLNATRTVVEVKDEYFPHFHKNIEEYISRLGEQRIFSVYKRSKYKNFVKGTGLHLAKKTSFIRRKDFTSYVDDCLIRNTVGNEDLLIQKIDNNYPFWFIDSGYTNFLETNKKWHRLVRNHLHYGKFFDAPVDRLGNFKTFPAQWRQSGEIIYVIEPGPFAAGIFHVNLKTWKYEVEKQIRKYSDKPIKFREKAPKDERTSLYEELCNDDFYCVISINSNASTESIWAGVPAITLDKHITNPVTKNNISDINDLYRGNLANWLCMLSYSQFTKQELMNGTAKQIIDKYHG